MHQTKVCTPAGCDSGNRCVNDYSLNNWTNQTCGGDACTNEQMYQTSPTFYGCYTVEQCVNDPCSSWVDQTCGGDACLPSQMHQTRDCTYNCKSESQCNDRTLGSPTPSVNLNCGKGNTIFNFSWTTPAASNCPVDPVKYYWKVDDTSWSSPLSGLTVSAGPYTHGNHTFYVKVKDASGRESAPGSVSFSVDALGPSKPSPTYSPVCGVVTGTTVTFSWNAVSDSGCSSGTIKYAWNVDKGVTGPWSAWQSGTSATWTAVTGEHKFWVKARDGVGNESEVGYITIGVDCFDGPTINTGVNDCTRASKRRPTWWWEATPVCAAGIRKIDSYQIFLDDDPTENINWVDQGFFTAQIFQPSFDLEDGHYALMVRAFDTCDQFGHSNPLEAEAYVDGTAPVFTSFSCSQGTGPDGMDECLDNLCSQENYVGFNWTAEDQGDYPSDLRSNNTYYWYVNFAPFEPQSGYTNGTFWGPNLIPDNIAPNGNKFGMRAYDVCGNPGTIPEASVPNLLIDTHPPISSVGTPANNGCFNSESIFGNFSGTTKDEACAGVLDLDIWIKRQKDNFCWDASEWNSTCPLFLDTSINELDPPIDEGETLAWTRANDIPWPDNSSYDGEYQVCSVAEDSFNQKQGTTDSCNLFIYDNTLPICGNTIEISDEETGSWITTSTENILVETAGFRDDNCLAATYEARILRNGIKIWPVGQDWYRQIDTICTVTEGGKPNNRYSFQGIPPPGSVDGDQVEICFDVVDCADNKASENSLEDCPVMEFAPGLCKTVTIFSPAWFQTQGGNLHVNTVVSKSIYSDIPSVGNPNPFFSLKEGIISAGGGMDFGAGSVSSKGWRVDDYSGTLYQVEKKGYDFFWKLFGRPADAPGLKGNTSNPCNNGLEIAGAKVCYNPGDLTIEYKDDDEPLDFGGVSGVKVKVIFVNGDLQINRKIIVEDEDKESVVVFFVKGDLNISWNLESASLDDPILEGVYVVDGRIYSARIAENAGKECIFDEETGYSDPSTCEFDHNNNPNYTENEWPGKRLVAEGIFITHGGFWLTSPFGRTLKGCVEGRLVCNKNTPAELFVYRPDLFENLPAILKEQTLSWEEVAP